MKSVSGNDLSNQDTGQLPPLKRVHQISGLGKGFTLAIYLPSATLYPGRVCHSSWFRRSNISNDVEISPRFMTKFREIVGRSEFWGRIDILFSAERQYFDCLDREE